VDWISEEAGQQIIKQNKWTGCRYGWYCGMYLPCKSDVLTYLQSWFSSTVEETCQS